MNVLNIRLKLDGMSYVVDLAAVIREAKPIYVDLVWVVYRLPLA